MLQVQLLRIDSRLLHGQVATNWARVLKIDRIIVASDSVAQDALRLILGGIEVSRINIGSLSFDNSKKMISDTVAVSQRDIQVFQLLHQHGIQLEIQKVSSDSPKDLWQILIDKHLITE